MAGLYKVGESIDLFDFYKQLGVIEYKEFSLAS
jgi:hypothetical protein